MEPPPAYLPHKLPTEGKKKDEEKQNAERGEETLKIVMKQ